MLTRCRNPNREDWPRYGGRGIDVCARWLRFENFLEDMGLRPEGTTLDRKDTDGNYTLDNCKWSTPLEQVQNRPKGFFKGERNNPVVLTLEQVKEIKEAWEDLVIAPNRVRRRRGTAYPLIRKLAAKYQVSFGCIAKIVYNTTWRET
jgi:hypothetical protein